MTSVTRVSLYIRAAAVLSKTTATSEPPRMNSEYADDVSGAQAYVRRQVEHMLRVERVHREHEKKLAVGAVHIRMQPDLPLQVLRASVIAAVQDWSSPGRETNVSIIRRTHRPDTTDSRRSISPRRQLKTAYPKRPRAAKTTRTLQDATSWQKTHGAHAPVPAPMSGLLKRFTPFCRWTRSAMSPPSETRRSCLPDCNAHRWAHSHTQPRAYCTC